ncbi:Zinc finger protein 26 [Amphibalanus amphitrite]|uniref:Zinc finger protein 26 n=1 Tax=Amphibalanus amphitrite TaxID=1232801 RepID=A0A6A4W8L0_AMPAM|nr:Zinc finger protein 26 [Amphibalanus amphitrite]
MYPWRPARHTQLALKGSLQGKLLRLETDPPPAAAARGKKAARRPDAARYVCPAPGCGRPCGHRKSLVLHVKWDHLQAPVCCRACRSELNTYAHFLYHNRTCFQGVSALVCPDCDARFTMELPYKRHLAGHALNACHKCGERLSSRKALVKHLRHEHNIRECEKWFTCDKCPKKFMKKRSWLTHSKVHATQDDTQCGRCGLTVSKQRLAEHIKTEHGHEPFTCATCHKRFRRNQQYLQHMRLHEQYDCSLCGQPFVTQPEYAAHMQSAHQIQPDLLTGPALTRYRCEVCGAAFWSRTQLSQHLDSHPDVSLECSRCQTEFETAAQLHRHLRRSLCSRSPQLICHHCGAQFCAHFALRKHLVRAHGEGPAKVGRCPHCDYTNSSAANLRRHIAAHEQLARRYVCDQCAAAFHTLSTLKDHQLYVHTTEKRFTCGECQKAFKTSSSLNRHMRVHSETRPYQCYCGNSYKRMSHLRRHMTAVHNMRTRTRLIERFDGSAAASSDSGSDGTGSTGAGGGGGGAAEGGGGGGTASSGGGDSGGPETVPEAAVSEPAQWSGLMSEHGVAYIPDEGVLRLYSVDTGEELPEEFTLPQGIYNTEAVFLADGSRSIVLKPAGELSGQLDVSGGGELVAAGAAQEPTATLPPPSTIRSSQQSRLV